MHETFIKEKNNMDAPINSFTAVDFEKAKPSLLAWPSEKAVKEHFKLYNGYINKANEITTKLRALEVDPAKSNQIFSEIRSLKLDYTFAIGGVKHHEMFFSNLGGSGGAPQGRLAEMIARDFQSIDLWKNDLKATGIASRGWSWLAYDHDTKKLFNYLGDGQNTYPVWNCTPIIALDVYEHAYWMDYGAARASFIDEWFLHLDWQEIERRFAQIPM